MKSDKLEDSGERQKFGTGAVRDIAGNKPRPDLISPYFSMRVGAHLEKGATKYAERNWEKGMPISRCIASLERHIMEYKMGLTNEDHLAAIGCNIMFIIHYEEMISRGLLPRALGDMPHYEFFESTEAKHEEGKITYDDAVDGECYSDDRLCFCSTCRTGWNSNLI